jgi:DNA-directed RNA polymerase subunit RPC12/RpoP
LNKKKKHPRAPRKLPDFSLADILNAPKPKVAAKRADGLGCNHCGSMRFISKGDVKVMRGQRMKVYHCHDCGKNFYKGE